MPTELSLSDSVYVRSKFLPQNYTGLPIIYASSKELSANFTFLELTDLDKRLETSEVAHLRDGKGLVIVGV